MTGGFVNAPARFPLTPRAESKKRARQGALFADRSRRLQFFPQRNEAADGIAVTARAPRNAVRL